MTNPQHIFEGEKEHPSKSVEDVTEDGGNNELRHKALRLAVDSCVPDSSTRFLTKRAQAFYEFLAKTDG